MRRLSLTSGNGSSRLAMTLGRSRRKARVTPMVSLLLPGAASAALSGPASASGRAAGTATDEVPGAPVDGFSEGAPAGAAGALAPQPIGGGRRKGAQRATAPSRGWRTCGDGVAALRYHSVNEY